MSTNMTVAETDRLAALQRCHIVDTPPEHLFDDLTRLAASVTGAPVALLGFVDAEREWIKSRHRWNISFIPKEASLSAHVVGEAAAIVVGDASKDHRFASSPLVASDPLIRFYAGVPVFSSDGFAIGALGVYDRMPRELAEVQLELLKSIAAQVGAHINARRRMYELTERLSEIDEMRLALKESDERFRDLFDNVDDLIMTFRPDGRLLHLNSAASLAIATDTDEWKKQTIFDFVVGDARAELETAFREVAESGHAQRVETTLATTNGGRIVVDGTLVPKIVDGYPVLIRVIFRDITDRKKIELELSRARDAALEAARVKSQFLSNVSHEIRTPIHALAGMIGLLLDSPLNAEQREFAVSARASADSLLAIINNILHVSRLEGGKLSASLADFDVVTTVERVVEVMKIAAQEKGLELTTEFEPQLPAVVRGDPGRYRQVLVNLLTNAIKFTDRGKIAVKVAVERETDTHTLVRLSVSDTGVGIPAEARQQMFGSFFQVDSSSTRKHSGMGLGLTISKQLVELMGGVIDYSSREGEGSTFWFTIPFERRTGERLTVEGAKHSFPGARVLIIDQSETNRKLIQHYAASWAMRTRPAENEGEALERLRSEAAMGDPFHVVIFDYQMPPNGGLSLARAIRNDPSIASTGLIMQTFLGEQIDDVAARAAGVSAYVAKPIDRGEFFDALSAAMAKETLRREIADPASAAASAGGSARTAGPIREVPKEKREGIRILLAEDKPLNQKLTLSQLRSLGYTHAEAVSNGDEVMHVLRDREFDIILMDCQMPIMDGYETTMEIRRAEGERRKTRIIAMTANALEGDREKCLAAGMDDYLSKPTKREDLDAAIARAYAEREE